MDVRIIVITTQLNVEKSKGYAGAKLSVERPESYAAGSKGHLKSQESCYCHGG